MFVADSIAEQACHLAHEAVQEPLAVLGEDAQNDSRRATIPDRPAAVETAAPSPKSGVPELPPRDGPSDSRVQ